MAIPVVSALTEGALIPPSWFDAIKTSYEKVKTPPLANLAVTGAGQTTTLATYTDIPTITMSYTLELPISSGGDPANRTMVWCSVTLQHSAGIRVWLDLQVGSSTFAEVAVTVGTAAQNYTIGGMFSIIPADTPKTIKARWRMDTASGTLTLPVAGNWMCAWEIL